MIPAEIEKLAKLSWLVLSNNQLTVLPAEIGNLTELDILFLQGNRLSTLPKEIGKLTMLLWLYLYENELTTLPAEIGNCVNLTELNLNCNRLTAIMPEIGNLTNLYKLVVYNNRLTTLPEEIGNLNNITRLDVALNYLTEPKIPAGLLPWLDRNDPYWRTTQHPVGILTDQTFISPIRRLTVFYTGTALALSRPLAPNSSITLVTLVGRFITARRIMGESTIQNLSLPAGILLWRITEDGIVINGRILVR
jgi:hypothetical protein